MATIRLRRGELDGIDLHYVSSGQGPVTVLVHGLGGFAESWRGTLAALQPHSQVIALDLPGFGQSAKPNRRYTLGFFGRVLEEFLEALAFERVRLVGHSLGGAVALTFAVAHAERVERLALLAPAVPGFPLRPALLFRLMSVPRIGEFLSRFVTPSICTAALSRCFVKPQPDEVAFLVGHQYATRVSVEGCAAYLATLRGVKEAFTDRAATYRTALARWDRPTLMIHGRQDPVIPVRHAESAARAIRNLEARWVEGCGHFPQLEHCAVVNAWLGEFLLAEAGR
ncbi:MAG TPA: alpha/beta fold hydrolase [Candidatus Methylomirabilis sp.]|nr:alpha/beta fold hydrolase [Candidatus Methylomirabilis sp.]